MVGITRSKVICIIFILTTILSEFKPSPYKQIQPPCHQLGIGFLGFHMMPLSYNVKMSSAQEWYQSILRIDRARLQNLEALHHCCAGAIGGWELLTP